MCTFPRSRRIDEGGVGAGSYTDRTVSLSPGMRPMIQPSEQLSATERGGCAARALRLNRPRSGLIQVRINKS